MIKNLLIKWHTEKDRADTGKFWLAANLLSEEFDKDMIDELKSDEMINTVIKAYYKKYRFKLFYWWVRYGFKCNKMYWYSEAK